MLANVSPALQERLGLEGTVGLLAVLESAKREWSGEVTDVSVQRFECRLTEEASTLRAGLKQDGHLLRLDFARLENVVDKALLNQTRWMIGMWVGQIAATTAIVGAMLQAFAD